MIWVLQTRYYFSHEFTRFLEIFKKYPHQKRKFKKNMYLSKANEVFDCNDYIVSGLVKVAVIHDSGEEKVIGYFGSGSIYPIICNEQKFLLEHSIVVKAINDVSTLRFLPQTIKEIMKDNPEISYEMIDHYCKFTNLLFFCATTQTYEDVQTRVCNILYIYYLNTGNKKVNLTQSEIGSIIGSTRVSVVKILKNLRSRGIIETTRYFVEILDLKQLTEFCSMMLIE